MCFVMTFFSMLLCISYYYRECINITKGRIEILIKSPWIRDRLDWNSYVMSHAFMPVPTVLLHNTDSLNLKRTILLTFLFLSMSIIKFIFAHCEFVWQLQWTSLWGEKSFNNNKMSSTVLVLFVYIFLLSKATMFHLNTSIGVLNKEYIIWLQRNFRKKPSRMLDI